MNNSDMPAKPLPNGADNRPYFLLEGEGFRDGHAIGLTKREYACIHCGVPETGDPDLDAIIAKGNEYRHNIQSFTTSEPDYSFDNVLISEALRNHD